MRFCDEKARDDFFENFFDWVIHLECQVILFDFLDTLLPDAFSSWGWASLYEIPKRCPSVFINIHAINTSIRDTTTRDKLIFPSTAIHVHVTIPLFSPFYVMGAISKEPISRIDAQLVAKWPHVESTSMDATSTSPHLPLPFFHLKLTFLLLPSWISFNLCVLTLVVVLTIFLMRCVK